MVVVLIRGKSTIKAMFSRSWLANGSTEKRGEMKKSRVNDQDQDMTRGWDEESTLTSATVHDASDSSITEVNSEVTSDHIIDRDIQAGRGTQKKSYSKPTLTVYGTDRELARRLRPKS